MKKHGKGKGITINGSRDPIPQGRRGYADVCAGLPVRPFTPLKITREMTQALERCKELTRWPSKFA